MNHMFTGIIEAIGQVVFAEGSRLKVKVPRGVWDDDGFEAGESVSIEGVCLTALESASGKDGVLDFDVSPETFRRTTLGGFTLGSPVNLERAMKANSRFGGHIVQGHVDVVGDFLGAAKQIGEDGSSFRVAKFRAPHPFAKYVVDKGSIALNGISLTVVDPVDVELGVEFDVWLVPHTWTHTTLQILKRGDRVNVEVDSLARYVERIAAYDEIWSKIASKQAEPVARLTGNE